MVNNLDGLIRNIVSKGRQGSVGDDLDCMLQAIANSFLLSTQTTTISLSHAVRTRSLMVKITQ